MRTGYRLILEQGGAVEIIGEAATGEEALPQIRRLQPDVVLCDLHLPGISGLDVTERIVRADIGTRVIIVSIQEDGPMPRRLIEAGASGYLGKGCDPQELVRAVSDVFRGRRYLASDVAQRMALDGFGGQSSPFDALSPRELQVARLPARTDGGEAAHDDGPEALLQALRAAHWNVSAVARAMGLSRMTLYRRMKRAGIVPPNRMV